MKKERAKTINNKILTFPKELREEIDSMIMKNIAITKITKYIENTNKEYKVCFRTVDSYKKIIMGNVNGNGTTTALSNYDKTSDELEQGLTEIKNEQLAIESSHITDKSAYVDALIFKVNKKLSILDAMDSVWRGFDPKKERIYQGYINLARELIETKAKLGGELKEEHNIVINMWQSQLSSFQKLVYDTIKEVCPEKLIEFQTVYKRKYIESKGNDTITELPKKVN